MASGLSVHVDTHARAHTRRSEKPPLRAIGMSATVLLDRDSVAGARPVACQQVIKVLQRFRPGVFEHVDKAGLPRIEMVG